MELIIFLAFVALFIAARSAHIKISRLEKRIDSLQAGRTAITKQLVDAAPPSPVSDNDLQQTSPQPIPAPTPIPTAGNNFVPASRPFEMQHAEPEPLFLYTWFKEHTLIKIGSIIFFCGAAWFVTYAFDQNWVPPIVRVAMGLILTLVIYGVGAIRESIEKTQYIVLTALGSAVVFVTVLAAQFSFSQPLLPGVVSLFILIVAITYTVFAALRTDTEWLAVTAAVAALFAPQFTGSDVTSVVPLFTYLLFVSAGLGCVALFTAWRFVALTMVSGFSVYALLASDVVSQQSITWLFVIFGSLLFLAITSVSILRNRIPLLTDGLTLLIIGLLYAYFTHTVATLPALAMFAAAALAAAVGYVARMREVDPSAVLLYAVCSIVGIFAGTAYLFDGVTATFFFAIESAALVFLAMRFAFLEKTIYLSTATFALPIIMGLFTLGDEAWQTGLMHSSALAVVTVSVCLGGIGLYLFTTAERTSLAWLQGLANSVIAAWYGFTVLTLIVIAKTTSDLTDTSVAVWGTILLLALSLLLMFVSLTNVNRETARGLVLWTLILPVGFACALIAEAAAFESFGGIEVIVLGGTLGSLIGLTALYANLASTTRLNSDRTAWYSLLWTSVLFASLWFTSYYQTIFSSGIALAVSAITFTAVCYGVINILLRYQVSFGKIIPFVIALIVPTIGLLPSLDYSSWVGGVLSIDAVSLYVHITVLALLAKTLFWYQTTVAEDQVESVRTCASALIIGASVLGFVLVWSLSHVLVANAVVAVTVALFVYTIAGLVLYVFGKRTDREMYVRAGYILLAAVVLRLGLVDVWGMELFWRIITFLGIGALFIMAALLERGTEDQPVVDISAE